MLILGALATFPKPSLANNLNVTCQADGSVPTVKVSLSAASSSESQEFSLLSFLPQYFLPEQAGENCETTAKILHSLYRNGDANYLATDQLHDGPVVCAVERRGVGCDHYKSQILFALEPTVNPSQALYEMLGSQFKQVQQPSELRTLSRIYTDINPSWWTNLTRGIGF